ncbi:hypothetical protein BSLA_01r5563 [Burkholderia stabilis]|nr:hypothetical protein BSLA_01r5563 [Burkholderia stabilis]
MGAMVRPGCVGLIAVHPCGFGSCNAPVALNDVAEEHSPIGVGRSGCLSFCATGLPLRAAGA